MDNIALPSAIRRRAKSISALVKYLLPLLAIISGNEGNRNRTIIPSPMAGIPSAMYSHCQE
jgi:hypothetical protein